MGFPEVQVVETGKSMTFRINVTPIDFNDEFEKIDKKVLDECFTRV
jgi:Mg2+/Co2+ transporter CorB